MGEGKKGLGGEDYFFVVFLAGQVILVVVEKTVPRRIVNTFVDPSLAKNTSSE